jgi:CSLREA domain-containing protein
VPALAAALLLLPAVAAQAQIITVNTTADVPSAQCTLRDAIKAANTDLTSNGCTTPGSGTDTIQFQLPNPSTITLGSALDQITGDVNIQGPAASQLTVSGHSLYRVFSVAAGKTVSISGLTITAGSVVVTGCPGTAATEGSGIYNHGMLTLDRVVVSGNNITATDGGGFNLGCAIGAGIFNDVNSTLTLERSTVSSNRASSTATGAGDIAVADGAGIDNGGTLKIDQSTLNDNTVHASVSGGATPDALGAGIRTNGSAMVINSTVTNNGEVTPGGQGGGIYANGSATSLALRNDTISQNIASASAGDGGNLYINGSGPAVTTKNTIVAAPLSSGNCGTTLPTSLGNNLGFESPSDNHPCFTPGNGNVFGDPMLGTLQDNGGATKTEAIGPGSAALNAGSGCEPTDQRGLFRGGAAGPCDVGAFELGATVSPPPTGGGTPGGGTPGAATPGATTPTGQRAAALKKCKHKHGRARSKCKKRARTLPV